VSYPAFLHKRAKPATGRTIHPPPNGKGFLAAVR
jgi:hypothetical protein